MPNRLIHESSPYLLQHAHNPVNWYPWGKEALNLAQTQDKPIFLSIGYSACHWCHVMAHESFENEATAAIMNEHFINIKVDREERPDLDSIYMDAVLAITGGHGGWPMSLFLTPAGVPFYGGTYYPPTPRPGSPAFEQVLLGIAHAYRAQPEQVNQNGEALTARIQGGFSLKEATGFEPAIRDLAIQALSYNFDKVNGGFGDAPKFPQPTIYDFLLRAHHRNRQPGLLQMIELSLQKMADGGMYDQLGGGFHRYSVDAVWLTPHFEKMLYDNALLARLYLHAYQLTGNPFYRNIVEETLDYVIRGMTDPAGGFYSSQDADSEGEEGKFFLWTPAEINSVLGQADGQLFCAAYNVQPGGNFEGKSILNRPVPLHQLADQLGLTEAELAQSLRGSRAKLFATREQRPKPARDEKVLTAWNGLMLAALAEAARVLNRPDYLEVAHRNAEFTLLTMLRNGRLFRTWTPQTGVPKLMGYLEDYAFYADGLLALYQTTFAPRWFQHARQLMDVVLEQFADSEDGGFFDTAADHETLIARPKNMQDNAIPCGNSMTARVLLLLAAYTGNSRYEQPAIEALAALQQPMRQYPAAFTTWLGNFEFALARPKEVAIIGLPDQDDTRQLLAVAQQPYRPNQIVTVTAPTDTTSHPELAHNRPTLNGQATAYVCHNFTCQQPVVTPLELEQLLNR